MLNYTKGRWIVEPVNTDMVCVLTYDPKTKRDTFKYIAELDPCSDERFANDEVESDALLIAAAPDMFEALIALRVAQSNGYVILPESVNNLYHDALIKAGANRRA